jgi:hypothetical protein
MEAIMSDPTIDHRPAKPLSSDPEISVHHRVVELAIGGVLWFIAVVWIAFARGPEVDFALAIVTAFFLFFFALFLLTASYGLNDPRWNLPKTSFRDFLVGTVRTATGNMTGREVMVEIAILPLALALAATLIGAAWMMVR